MEEVEKRVIVEGTTDEGGEIDVTSIKSEINGLLPQQDLPAAVPLLPSPQALTSHQIDTDVMQIDSILKALNSGTFDDSDMVTIDQLISAKPQVMLGFNEFSTSVEISEVEPLLSGHFIGPKGVRIRELVIPSTSSGQLGPSKGLSLIGEIDSSSSDSEATSSEDEDDREPPRYIELEDETVRTYKYGYPMTKNEIDYRDLPIVEEVVECPDNVSLTPVGTVLHTTEELTIIESQDGHMPISEGTVLWSDEREYLGRLFETFGPVQKPFYSVRVKGVEKMVPGMMVYVAVGDPHLTHYVFNENVYRGKGCDASWHNDCEAPEEFQDFSDDEAEAISKAMRKHHIKT